MPRMTVSVVYLIFCNDSDGYREILGVKITDNESEGFWTGLFDELKYGDLKYV
jgi:transposase-like protein